MAFGAGAACVATLFLLKELLTSRRSIKTLADLENTLKKADIAYHIHEGVVLLGISGLRGPIIIRPNVFQACSMSFLEVHAPIKDVRRPNWRPSDADLKYLMRRSAKRALGTWEMVDSMLILNCKVPESAGPDDLRAVLASMMTELKDAALGGSSQLRETILEDSATSPSPQAATEAGDPLTASETS